MSYLTNVEDVNIDKVVPKVPEVQHRALGRDPGIAEYAKSTGGATSLAPDKKLMHNFHSNLGSLKKTANKKKTLGRDNSMDY